ncbi:MAG: rRNA maturation RNase YbeY [Rhodocyclaceae bacterium]|nr:rRNA maturation RNase YbeY [Rhodocyclaceae bacterium]
MAALHLSVQRALARDASAGLPRRPDFLRWARAALQQDAEVSIRLVGEAEGRSLNSEYRGKDYATNVLSFAYGEGEDMPLPEGMPLVGDLVLCAPVVAAEAAAQGKPLLWHYAHLVVHGMLHLQGYDHQDDGEAAEMEGLERDILAGLGIPDPYADPKLENPGA